MKKILLPMILVLLAAWAFAAGGAEDPLVSLSYLEGTFRRAVEAETDRRLNALGEGDDDGASGGWQERRLKQDDRLLGATGTQVLLLAGEGQVICPFGAVVDVTEGTEIASGDSMVPRHRYLVAEDAEATFLVTSGTAVAESQGPVTLAAAPGPDYYAIASALQELNLFRGTGTGYGGGFDLERQSNRIQALIMFLRLLGEEEEALAWSGSHPFADVQPGTQTERYVGYAWEKGYTNGYTATEFRPSQAVNAAQFTEFLLRALGYSVAGENSVADALPRAAAVGVLTAREALSLDAFLRAQMAYLSRYALEAELPGGGTLAGRLMGKGVFSAAQWSSVQALDLGGRL